MNLPKKSFLMFGLPALLAGPVVFAQTLSFSKPTVTPLPSQANSYIMPLDLNGDGNTDVAFDLNSKGYVYLGDGKGGFSTNAVKLSMEIGASDTLVDLNGDGKADVLLLYAGGPNEPGYDAQPGAFKVWVGDGKGNFKLTTNLVTPAADLSSYAIGDFNHDGLPDIAYLVSSSAGDGGETSLTIYLNQGGGVFKEGLHQPLENYPNSIVAGDFNGDGKIDVAWVEELGINGSHQAYGLHYMYGNGDGMFEGDRIYTLDSQPDTYLGEDENLPNVLLTADFNHDGHTDLEVALSPQSDSKGVSLPGAEKRSATLLAKQTEGFYWLSNVSNYRGLALEDYNGDGLIDMLVLVNAGSYSVLPGKSDFTFGAAEALPSGLNHPFLVPLTKGGLPAIIDGNSETDPTALRVFLNTSKK